MLCACTSCIANSIHHLVCSWALLRSRSGLKGLDSKGTCPKWTNLDTKSLKSRFDPKLKSPKMGLPITPCPFLKRPPFLRYLATPGAKYFEKVRKIREQWMGKLPFWAFYIGIPGLIQKSKVPKWVCRSPLAVGEAAPTRFAIFGPARGQIFRKKVEKIAKKQRIFAFFGFFI